VEGCAHSVVAQRNLQRQQLQEQLSPPARLPESNRRQQPLDTVCLQRTGKNKQLRRRREEVAVARCLT
jgi:hypothetical protein